ncbi:MAG: bifunctional glycosyltransferase/class I SAM-dependent methyltransferase, partial [Anaerolineaceae bacterium]
PHTRTSPIGMDTEVCSFAALKNAWTNAAEKYEREHVMPFLYDTPGRFRVKIVEREPSLGHLRFTVDTEADLQVARAVYAAFNNRDDFTLEELLAKNDQNPQWQVSLAGIKHKTFQDVDERAEQSREPLPSQSPPDPATRKAHPPSPDSAPQCPLCGGRQVKILQELKSFDFPVIYYHCQACGFVFQDAATSQAASPDFYTENYRKIYQATATPTAKDLRQQQLRSADQIRFLHSQGVHNLTRILDIGASSGSMLQAFQAEFGADVVGVEPGDAYRKLAETKGLAMFPSLKKLYESHPERFELVSLMHVLEHLENPVETLHQIREALLSSHGWLLLEVPNFYAHDSYELAHLACFTPHSIVETLHKAGYEVAFLRKHGYPRSELLNLYLNVLARPAQNPTPSYTVKPESAVPLKRQLAIFRRRVLTRLSPGRAWLPLEDK